MSERRKLTTLDKLNVAIGQAQCPLCNEKLDRLENTDFDHIQALALGGADNTENLRAVHRDCHKAKTFGNGATTRGADAGEIAHHRRLSAKQMEFRARLLAKELGTEPPVTKRKKPFGRRPKQPPKPQNSARRPEKFNFGIAQS